MTGFRVRHHTARSSSMDASRGFEPRSSASKAGVLPLDEEAYFGIDRLTAFPDVKSGACTQIIHALVFGAEGWIRTSTSRVLKPQPLPFGHPGWYR